MWYIVYILVLIIIAAGAMKYKITPDPFIGAFVSINDEGYRVVNVTDNLVTIQDLYGCYTHTYHKIIFKLISWPCL